MNKNKDEIKIFGTNFVENNKDNCYLLIDGKQCELCEFYKLKNNQKNKSTLEIKLIETNKITNMYCMLIIVMN